MIAVILANVFWNQIKILVRERVLYDRDDFNYEEYLQRGQRDNRLICNTLFRPAIKGSKNLVAEFFKYQKDKFNLIRDQPLSLLSSDRIIHNLNLLSIHVESLYKIHKNAVDIEPILLVFFQHSKQNICC